MADRNEGILGVYAATGPEAGAKLSVVIVNKDVNHVGLYIANIPTGNYFLRHFGGDAGVAKFQVASDLFFRRVSSDCHDFRQTSL